MRGSQVRILPGALQKAVVLQEKGEAEFDRGSAPKRGLSSISDSGFLYSASEARGYHWIGTNYPHEFLIVGHVLCGGSRLWQPVILIILSIDFAHSFVMPTRLTSGHFRSGNR